MLFNLTKKLQIHISTYIHTYFKALTVAGALADGFHRHSPRQGRRLSSRRQGRNRAFRRGRTEDLAAAAPLGTYGEETTAAPDVLPPPDYDYPISEYAAADAAPLDAYGADALADEAADPNLAMLEKAVPGIPGEDYPINAEVPETAFSCDGQVDGGKHFRIAFFETP